jgi:hypothetical protein
MSDRNGNHVISAPGGGAWDTTDRFIAETNAFLEAFRDHPEVGWPLKPVAAAPGPEVEVGLVGRAAVEAAALLREPHVLERIRHIRNLTPVEWNRAEPQVYLVLLVVPDGEQPSRQRSDEPLKRVAVRRFGPNGVELNATTPRMTVTKAARQRVARPPAAAPTRYSSVT